VGRQDSTTTQREKDREKKKRREITENEEKGHRRFKNPSKIPQIPNAFLGKATKGGEKEKKWAEKDNIGGGGGAGLRKKRGTYLAENAGEHKLLSKGWEPRKSLKGKRSWVSLRAGADSGSIRPAARDP